MSWQLFALPVTVYVVITFNISKWFRFESVIFRKKVNFLSYIVVEYIVGWLGCHCDGEKQADLSQTVFLWSKNETHTRTNTHTYTRTHSGESNRRECNALHFV